jgi:flagellar hook-basal body complex protein FliE
LPVHNNTTTQSFLNDNSVTEPFENQDLPKSFKYDQTDIDSSSKNSDDKKELFDVNIDKIYSDVVNHISKSQEEIDLNPYLHKFANIYITYKFLENNECNKKKFNSFFEPFEQNFLKSLNVALLKFNNLEAKFAEKDCDTFINNLDKSINSDTKLNKLQKKT